MEINYGLTSNFSFTALFSYIQQSRTISTFSNLTKKLTASGIGDIVLLSKYSLMGFNIFDRQELSVGIGLKVPIGNSSIKNNGILIPVDMQPGTGSWDTFFGGYYSKGGLLLSDLTILSSLSYRLNGSNNRFKNSTTGYSFGNEFIGLFGFNYPINSILDFTLMARFRNTREDTFGNDLIPAVISYT